MDLVLHSSHQTPSFPTKLEQGIENLSVQLQERNILELCYRNFDYIDQ